MVSKLAVWSSAWEAWRIIVTDAERLLRLVWPWLIAQLAAQAVSAGGAMMIGLLWERPVLGLLATGAAMLGGILAGLPIQTCIIRWVVAGPQTAAPLGRGEGRFFLAGAGCAAISICVLVPPIFVIVFAGIDKTTASWLSMACGVLAAPMVVRLAMALVPAALARDRIDYFAAWRRSRGNGLRILACVILVSLPALAFSVGLIVVSALAGGSALLPAMLHMVLL